MVLSTLLGGFAGIPSFIGFGINAPGLSVLGSTIDITNPTGTLTNFAFSVPRDGIITGLSAYFSTTVALSLIGTTVTIWAQLYESTTPNNVFSPVSGTVAALSPALTGILPIGTISSAVVTGLNIPVNTGSRYMLVFSARTTSGLDLATAIAGYASAGLAIS